ncbi:MAG TPA: Hpt domain-containing protein [Desulfotignum sp.]|nr:Hpt domain-containing protein [Desulfotignum sp.]
MDYKYLADQLDMDETEFLELVALFVDTTRTDLKKIRQGVSCGDFSRAAAAAHSIKGAAGNLGFTRMADLARKMETAANGASFENFDAYITDLETRVDALIPT